MKCVFLSVPGWDSVFKHVSLTTDQQTQKVFILGGQSHFKIPHSSPAHKFQTEKKKYIRMSFSLIYCIYSYLL